MSKFFSLSVYLKIARDDRELLLALFVTHRDSYSRIALAEAPVGFRRQVDMRELIWPFQSERTSKRTKAFPAKCKSQDAEHHVRRAKQSRRHCITCRRVFFLVIPSRSSVDDDLERKEKKGSTKRADCHRRLVQYLTRPGPHLGDLICILV
ncbi:hypothetical protein SISNIDRAFT_459825 [Sistotremastrum niveocremeum HHB9708]|uniref:Uncharacterized protein n=1 Tax=Sistotremastrum niveocremeum HHB9708 TaxID=1314777 RepID=A0A164P4T2_9AGAM|nr:hypothetical protein SISNIDRAFT_459825 [Sistotremastrum niveocremeum HHB9708]